MTYQLLPHVCLIIVLVFAAFWLARRWAAVVLFSLAALVAIVGSTEFLSRPKPTEYELLRRGLPEARMLWAQLRPGEGIYVVLTWAGQREPRLYVLPWDQRLAEQMTRAQTEGKRTGMGTMLRKPFGSAKADDGKPAGTGARGKGKLRGSGQGRDSQGAEERFYAPPQPAPPMKDELGQQHQQQDTDTEGEHHD